MIVLTDEDKIKYALLAGASYISTRNPVDQIPAPDGWNMIDHQTAPSGFEAAAYQNGNEIVISYAGTYFSDWNDWVNNVQLGVGIASEQLKQAETGSGLIY